MSGAAGIGPLAAAVLALLKATAGVTALLDNNTAVYDGAAPNPTTGTQPRKYLVIRSPSFTPTGVFGSDGADNALEIHVWHPDRKDAPTLAIVAAIGAALDHVKLTLGPGVRHWTGVTSLVAVLDDTQATPPLKHAVVRYDARTQ